MESISKKLKDSIIQSLEDNKIYGNPDFKQIIFDKTGMTYGKDYKESHFAGCLTALRKKGILVQTGRGTYRKGRNPLPLSLKGGSPLLPSPEENREVPENRISIQEAKERILFSIQKEIDYLQEITKKTYLDFDITEDDYQNIQKIKELIQQLQDFSF